MPPRGVPNPQEPGYKRNMIYVWRRTRLGLKDLVDQKWRRRMGWRSAAEELDNLVANERERIGLKAYAEDGSEP